MLRPAAALVALLLTCGCTTVSRSFPGHVPANVWTALVAVAETPDYADPDPDERWVVRENAVWVDDDNRRIEIYRKLDRVLQRASTDPLRQQRTWRFQVRFEATEPPSALFTSRGWGIPTEAASEGDRYFADVWRLLHADPSLLPVLPASPPAPPPPGDDDGLFPDIDLLDAPEG